MKLPVVAGFPIGAVAGRAEVMDVLNPQSPRYVFPHSGTFTANPISMTAGMAAMLKFDQPAVARLNALTDRARNGIEDAIRATGTPASVTGAGSMFLVHMKQTPKNISTFSFHLSTFLPAYPTPDESRRLKALLDHLYNEGCIIISSGACVFSTPMTEAEIDTLVGAFKSGFAKLASMG